MQGMAIRMGTGSRDMSNCQTGMPLRLCIETLLGCDTTSGKGLGIRVYNGDGDNDGTTKERTDRCAAACFKKRTAIAYGPWEQGADAVGFALTDSGRCYCQHEGFAGCTKGYTNKYVAYEYTTGQGLAPPMHTHNIRIGTLPETSLHTARQGHPPRTPFFCSG